MIMKGSSRKMHDDQSDVVVTSSDLLAYLEFAGTAIVVERAQHSCRVAHLQYGRKSGNMGNLSTGNCVADYVLVGTAK